MLSYSDLVLLKTFEQRLRYLRVDAAPAEETFGVLRGVNQKFYASRAWKAIRKTVIARDLGFDLGVPGREIVGRVIVHHINPITPQDIYYSSPEVLNPDNLITTCHDTHLQIHFRYRPVREGIVERRPGDTKLW